MESSHHKSEDSEDEQASKKKRAIKAPLLHAEQLHAAPHAPERIGHVLVNGQSAEKKSSETSSSHSSESLARAISGAEGLRVAAAGKRIESLNRVELIDMAEKISVNGSTLRQIYETHLIGEKGLRRLIAEHLRGGDLEEALRREIVEHEIDFERDPALRGMNPDSGSVDANATSGEEVLIKLLESAADSVPNASEEIAFYKAKAAKQAVQQEERHKKRRLLDLSLISAIVILMTAVAALYLTRH